MADFKSEREQIRQIESLIAQDKLGEALYIAEKLVEDFSMSFQAKYVYFTVLKGLRRLDEAEDVLRQLYKTYPENLKLILELGDMEFRKRSFEESKNYYNKILFLDPFNSQAKERITAINKIIENRVQQRLDDTQSEWRPLVSPAYQTESALGGDLNQETELEKIPQGNLVKSEVIETFNQNSIADYSLSSIQSEYQEETIPVAPLKTNESGTSELVVTRYDEDLFPSEPSDNQRDPISVNSLNELSQLAQSTRNEIVVDPFSSEEDGQTSVVTNSIEEKPSIASDQHETDWITNDTYSQSQALDTPDTGKSTGELNFSTESAADLYMQQGCFAEAREIYEHLLERTGDRRYSEKLFLLSIAKKDRIKMQEIERLMQFLTLIRKRGIQVV